MQRYTSPAKDIDYCPKEATPISFARGLQQAKSIIVGAAIGDALGFYTEALDRETIYEQFGSGGVQELSPNGAYFSDDTQLSLAVARALINLQELDLELFMNNLGHEFIAWRHAPGSRLMGGACIEGIARFESGIPWSSSGVPGAKGNGSAMRVAPIGYLLADRPALLGEFAAASSRITHGSQSAATAAKIAAHAIAAALAGAPPRVIINESLQMCRSECSETWAKLQLIEDALCSNRSAHETFDSVGAGWIDSEAIALALYACAAHPDSYVDTIRLAANHWGDSDTIAAIAGGIQAARLGIDSIPADWLTRIEASDTLFAISYALWEAKQRLCAV